jgi:hypothetical protein
MPEITSEELRMHNQYLVSLHTERTQWESLWRELSDNYLPQRYRWLMNSKEFYANRARRQYIINNTGTQAARVLAAGMMNGITSPSRPWFKLRIPGIKVTDSRELSVWLEEVERVMLRVMAESNFYNSMAVMYLDMAVFGTAANLIYSDYNSVIRCYNPPLGEYYVAKNHLGSIDIFARRFMVKVHEYVRRWPNEAYWSDRVKNAVQQGGSNLNMDIEIAHFIGPNSEKKNMVPKKFKYYELYWEAKCNPHKGTVLEKNGFNELPGIFARWEVSGTDAYGVSPGMDALGDVIELQHLHRNKAELLEKMHKPPLLVDTILMNSPLAIQPKGVTFVPNLNNTAGAKPVFTVNPNFSELNADGIAIENRIRNTFFNFLFTGISDLQTVRSAAEVEAREGEKLILLGGVLERFESEALDPAIKRIYSITSRAGLFPPVPQEFANLPLEIQYVSILSVAQRAVGTAPAERWMGLLGNVAAVRPDALDLPDWDVMLTNYARDIGMRESEIKDTKQVEVERQMRAQQQQMAQMAEAAPQVAGAGKALSETEVGGGGNALELLLGGGQ